jgi:hypothetical protein
MAYVRYVFRADGNGSLTVGRDNRQLLMAGQSTAHQNISQCRRDGFVSQWYDQSGNDNHATQGTDAKSA